MPRVSIEKYIALWELQQAAERSAGAPAGWLSGTPFETMWLVATGRAKVRAGGVLMGSPTPYGAPGPVLLAACTTACRTAWCRTTGSGKPPATRRQAGMAGMEVAVVPVPRVPRAAAVACSWPSWVPLVLGLTLKQRPPSLYCGCRASSAMLPVPVPTPRCLQEAAAAPMDPTAAPEPGAGAGGGKARQRVAVVTLSGTIVQGPVPPGQQQQVRGVRVTPPVSAAWLSTDKTPWTHLTRHAGCVRALQPRALTLAG